MSGFAVSGFGIGAGFSPTPGFCTGSDGFCPHPATTSVTASSMQHANPRAAIFFIDALSPLAGNTKAAWLSVCLRAKGRRTFVCHNNSSHAPLDYT